MRLRIDTTYSYSYSYPNATPNTEPTMHLIPPLLQIAMLALGFASNRADAMAGAAAFAVITVAVVILKDRRAPKTRTNRLN